MWRSFGVLVWAVLLAACGASQLGQPETTSGSAVTLLRGDVGRVEAACEPILEHLMDGNTAELISSLEDLDAILSTAGAEDLRQHIHSASDALPVFEDTPPL